MLSQVTHYQLLGEEYNAGQSQGGNYQQESKLAAGGFEDVLLVLARLHIILLAFCLWRMVLLDSCGHSNGRHCWCRAELFHVGRDSSISEQDFDTHVFTLPSSLSDSH